MWSGRRVVAPPPPPSPHLSPRPCRRGCPASALLAAHPPRRVGLRALDPLVARQLRLCDGADDDDARALDEDREEDAYQRLGEGDRGGVLEAEQCGDDGEEGGADGEGDEAQPRALRDLVAEPADVCEAFDLIGPERVEGGAALQNGGVLEHDVERLLLAHHLEEDVFREKQGVAKRVRRVDYLRVGEDRLARERFAAVRSNKRAPELLELLPRVFLLESLRHLDDVCWQPLAAHARRRALSHHLHLVGLVDLLHLGEELHPRRQ
mmetsp:Transcript_31418/g.100490  ORF Transcript_31418/g.100490 Transcript_31418/m.100490 type:complete len:265 (+) Transcript_31418:128-922(+)